MLPLLAWLRQTQKSNPVDFLLLKASTFCIVPTSQKKWHASCIRNRLTMVEEESKRKRKREEDRERERESEWVGAIEWENNGEIILLFTQSSSSLHTLCLYMYVCVCLCVHHYLRSFIGLRGITLFFSVTTECSNLLHWIRPKRPYLNSGNVFFYFFLLSVGIVMTVKPYANHMWWIF